MPPARPWRARDAAVRQAYLDQEGIAAIHGRRTRRGTVKLARHHLMQALQNELLANGHEAVGRRGADPRVLNRLIERVGLLPADLFRFIRVLILASSQTLRATLS